MTNLSCKINYYDKYYVNFSRSKTLSSRWIFSKTEIDVFSSYKHKWGYIYVDSIKPTQCSANEFGSLVHKFLFNALSNKIVNYNTREDLSVTPNLPLFFVCIQKNITKGNEL